MEDSYSENLDYQAQQSSIQFLSIRSPNVNPEISQPIIVDAPLEMESYEDKIEAENCEPVYATTYDTTFSPHSVSGSSMVEEVLDECLNSGLQSYGSQQMIANSMTMDTQTFIKTAGSAQIQRGPKNYQDQDRQDKIDRYRGKKQSRKFGKTVRYPSRKRVADQRLRFDGKFQKDEGQLKKQLKPIEMTPKKPRQTIGKNETIALLQTTSSIKGKRQDFTVAKH